MSFLESMMFKYTSSRVDPVRNSAKARFAMIAFPFSQVQAPVSTIIGTHKDTAGGVCAALSSYWILYHAAGGSLWNYLYDNSKLRADVLMREIMWLQRRSESGAKNKSQEKILLEHLDGRGISIMRSPKKGYKAQKRLKRVSGGITPGKLAADLITDYSMSSSHKSAGHYKLLMLQGRWAGHAMALWVAEDIVFFDPNFGEIWFENPYKFAIWFAQEFWSTSRYNVGLNKAYDIASLSPQEFDAKQWERYAKSRGIWKH